MIVSPSPVQVILCELCQQPWDDHVKMAKREARDRFYDMFEDVHEDPVTPPKDLVFVVETHHCVFLLKEAQRGPMGYVGPCGATGMAGRDATPQ